MTTTCHKCGASLAPDENFCGSCGSQRLRGSEPASDISAESKGVVTAEESENVAGPSEQEVVSGTETWKEDEVLGHGASESFEGEESLGTSRAGEGKKSRPKALSAGKILNNRYEIVRRVGGGGMGAVYLAKDRNLGEAPRAVKEMIESHIDDAQHEKAIADFKRESLLLTSLEHSSIPTVYDYFYDEMSERFYLVMKFIPGSDLASRLRNTPGGRIDELSVTEWGIQVADVLHYLHTRPQPIRSLPDRIKV